MSERDTHFQGFAELLVLQFDGLSLRYKDWPDWRELDRQMKLVIAQRAYDLACHVLEHATSEVVGEFFGNRIPYIIDTDIPDLTQWPEQT